MRVSQGSVERRLRCAWCGWLLVVAGCASESPPTAEPRVESGAASSAEGSVSSAEGSASSAEGSASSAEGSASSAEGSASSAEGSASSAEGSVSSAEGSASSAEGSASSAEGATAESAAGVGGADSGTSSAFVLGNALEPFDPPSREALEALEWVDNPVRDALADLRGKQAESGPPAVTASAALTLRNDGPESNAKILDALSRTAPADGTGVDYEATFVRHVAGDLKSTNPLFISSVTEFEYEGLTGVGFLSFDRDFNYFAPSQTVTSWQTTSDGMIDKIVIRPDLTWSDGRPVTAHDVEFTFKLIMTNHDELVIPAVRQGADQLKAVKAYDDRTIVYFHKEALATSRPNLIFPVVPKHVYETTAPEDPSLKKSPRHRELEDRPVVAGAYELSRRVRGQEFVVRRREAYFLPAGEQVRPKPYFAEIRVKAIEDMNTALLALKTGDIEEMTLRPEQWESQTSGDDFYDKNTKVTALEWTTFHFVWNVRSNYFEDRRVRWAMAYAMDYRELLETICRGLYKQGRGNFHPESWMFPRNGPEPLVQDLDKAEDLLDEAGWDDSDGDGVRDKEIDGKLVPFEFSLMTYQTDTGLQTATLLKECLDRIGIVCNVKPTEFTVMTQKLMDHEFDASMGGWGTSTDPYSNENIFGTGQNRNYGQYSNPEVDRLFYQGQREFDRAKRAEIYGKIHSLLWDDQAYLWLFYRNSFYAFNKKLRGYNFSPRGPYDYSPGFGSIYVPEALP